MSDIKLLATEIDELSKKMKERKAELKSAIEATDLYKKLLTSTMKQTSAGCKMPEKTAKAHALKVTLANLTKTTEESE